MSNFHRKHELTNWNFNIIFVKLKKKTLLIVTKINANYNNNVNIAQNIKWQFNELFANKD